MKFSRSGLHTQCEKLNSTLQNGHNCAAENCVTNFHLIRIRKFSLCSLYLKCFRFNFVSLPCTEKFSSRDHTQPEVPRYPQIMANQKSLKLANGKKFLFNTRCGVNWKTPRASIKCKKHKLFPAVIVPRDNTSIFLLSTFTRWLSHGKAERKWNFSTRSRRSQQFQPSENTVEKWKARKGKFSKIQILREAPKKAENSDRQVTVFPKEWNYFATLTHPKKRQQHKHSTSSSSCECAIIKHKSRAESCT